MGRPLAPWSHIATPSGESGRRTQLARCRYERLAICDDLHHNEPTSPCAADRNVYLRLPTWRSFGGIKAMFPCRESQWVGVGAAFIRWLPRSLFRLP